MSGGGGGGGGVLTVGVGCGTTTLGSVVTPTVGSCCCTTGGDGGVTGGWGFTVGSGPSTSGAAGVTGVVSGLFISGCGVGVTTVTTLLLLLLLLLLLVSLFGSPLSFPSLLSSLLSLLLSSSSSPNTVGLSVGDGDGRALFPFSSTVVGWNDSVGDAVGDLVAVSLLLVPSLFSFFSSSVGGVTRIGPSGVSKGGVGTLSLPTSFFGGVDWFSASFCGFVFAFVFVFVFVFLLAVGERVSDEVGEDVLTAAAVESGVEVGIFVVGMNGVGEIVGVDSDSNSDSVANGEDDDVDTSVGLNVAVGRGVSVVDKVGMNVVGKNVGVCVVVVSSSSSILLFIEILPRNIVDDDAPVVGIEKMAPK